VEKRRKKGNESGIKKDILILGRGHNCGTQEGIVVGKFVLKPGEGEDC